MWLYTRRRTNGALLLLLLLMILIEIGDQRSENAQRRTSNAELPRFNDSEVVKRSALRPRDGKTSITAKPERNSSCDYCDKFVGRQRIWSSSALNDALKFCRPLRAFEIRFTSQQERPAAGMMERIKNALAEGTRAAASTIHYLYLARIPFLGWLTLFVLPL